MWNGQKVPSLLSLLEKELYWSWNLICESQGTHLHSRLRAVKFRVLPHFKPTGVGWEHLLSIRGKKETQESFSQSLYTRNSFWSHFLAVPSPILWLSALDLLYAPTPYRISSWSRRLTWPCISIASLYNKVAGYFTASCVSPNIQASLIDKI